jgi:hypothetical protein
VKAYKALPFEKNSKINIMQSVLSLIGSLAKIDLLDLLFLLVLDVMLGFIR